ncbi:MAG: hypothetical protein ACLFWL_17020 [Candidatus Brocadiia bacterium]
MQDLKKLDVVEDAWQPDLFCTAKRTLAAWRTFDPDQGFEKPESIIVAEIGKDGLEDQLSAIDGIFHTSPRIAIFNGNPHLFAVQLQGDNWLLESYDLENKTPTEPDEKISAPSKNVPAFDIARSGKNNVIVWIETGPEGRSLKACRLDEDDVFDLACGPINDPVAVFDETGAPLVAWEESGAIEVVKLKNNLKVTEDFSVQLSDRYLGRPSITANDDVIFIACRSDGLWGQSTERLNEDTRINLFKYENGELQALDAQPAGQVPIPTTSRFESYRDEPPENRRLALAPTVVIDPTGNLRLLFRHFRDAQMNDWGWTLRTMKMSASGFEPAREISLEAGFPDGQYAVERESEDMLAAVTELDYPVSRNAFAQRSSSSPPRITFYRFQCESAATSAPWTPHTAAGPALVAGVNRLRQPWKDRVLIYADLHRHSSISRCIPEGDADVGEHLRWARDFEHHGSLCLTDHWLSQASKGEQRAGLSAVDSSVENGTFAPIFGAEPGGWRSIGDVNVYIPRRELVPHISELVEKYKNDLPEAISYLEKNDLVGQVIMQRHFHGMINGGHSRQLFDNELAKNDTVEPVIEVIQTRGHSIPWYCRMLQAGQHKGVTGGSDHCRPSDRQSPGCLTGLYVKEITQEGVWEALQSRCCFATNGRRFEMRIQASGTLMGGTVEADDQTPIQWSVCAPSELDRIDIFRDGTLLETAHPEETTTAAGTIAAIPPREGEASFFLTARTADGGLAISSPIWVRRDGAS